MASVNSPIRTFIKPLLFKILGKRGYVWAQFYGKKRDIENRLVEEKEMVLLPEFIKESDESIDVGANYAYFTVRMSELSPKGKVYAFEPIPFTYKVCKMLVKHFKAKNVELFQNGVGAKNETKVFNVPVMDYGAISAGQAHIGDRTYEEGDKDHIYYFEKYEEVSCDIVSLDSLLLDKLTKLTFIKIDIEGAEYVALQGMRKILQKFKPSILIEVVPKFLKWFNVEEAEFRRLIVEDLGYNFYLFHPETKKLTLETGDFIESNYILIHKDKTADFQYLIA